MRPVSIRRPTVATAMTATTVAIVPSRVPSSQRTAATITPEPAGSASDPCAAAADETRAADTAIRHRLTLMYLPNAALLPPVIAIRLPGRYCPLARALPIAGQESVA